MINVPKPNVFPDPGRTGPGLSSDRDLLTYPGTVMEKLRGKGTSNNNYDFAFKSIGKTNTFNLSLIHI